MPASISCRASSSVCGIRRRERPRAVPRISRRCAGSARTGAPAASAAATTSPPTFPVAPVTRIIATLLRHSCVLDPLPLPGQCLPDPRDIVRPLAGAEPVQAFQRPAHVLDPDVAVIDVLALVFGHPGTVEDLGHDGRIRTIGG